MCLNSRYSSKPFNSSTLTSRLVDGPNCNFKISRFSCCYLPIIFRRQKPHRTKWRAVSHFLGAAVPVHSANFVIFFFRHERFSAGTVAVGPVFLARFRAFTQVTVSVAVATHSILFFFCHTQWKRERLHLTHILRQTARKIIDESIILFNKSTWQINAIYARRWNKNCLLFFCTAFIIFCILWYFYATCAVRAYQRIVDVDAFYRMPQNCCPPEMITAPSRHTRGIYG